LTYRNANTFYDIRHDARCNAFTWTSTPFYRQTRNTRCLGAGFLGKNPIVVGETDLAAGDINSLNLFLGAAGNPSISGDNFRSVVSLCPSRREIGWLSQFYFNLDCFCTNLFASVDFAVIQARHKLGFHETATLPTNNTITLPGATNEDPAEQNVRTRLDEFNTAAHKCKHTGVDDVLLRLGYRYGYCGNDTMGIYLAGLVPTGKRFNNAEWFQPLVGSRHGAIGFGVDADYTVWSDECSNSDFVVMTELLFLYKLKHKENRVFDLNNGPLSRFLPATTAGEPTAAVNLVPALTGCVEVKPRAELEWWLAGRYQWCNFGFEASYNLFFRQREEICGRPFNFGEGDTAIGIFDAGCSTPLTTNSTATIGMTQEERAAIADPSFEGLSIANVNLRSGAAQKVLSHTFAGLVSYSSVMWDCWPFTVSFGGRYEFATNKYKRAYPEAWSVFGTIGVSF